MQIEYFDDYWLVTSWIEIKIPNLFWKLYNNIMQKVYNRISLIFLLKKNGIFLVQV